MQDQQRRGEVGQERPVGARAAPLPEGVGPLAGRGGQGGEGGSRGGQAVSECDVEEEDLHADCQEGLDEEGGAEVGAEPVEYPEQYC